MKWLTASELTVPTVQLVQLSFINKKCSGRLKYPKIRPRYVPGYVVTERENNSLPVPSS